MTTGILLREHNIQQTNQNMKYCGPDFLCSLLFFSILSFISSLNSVKAATPFQIVWGMNKTLSGASSSTNFSPGNAALTGAHAHSLPAVLWYTISSSDFAYGTTYWQSAPPTQKYLSFSYSVSTFEYNLTSVSFRVRRSGDGPADVSLRSSLDGFASNLSTFNLSADGQFYDVTVPLNLVNLSAGITFRLYASSASTYLGVLYFDQIVINGTVNSILLPVQLTYFEAKAIEKTVQVSWKTAAEKNSKEFVIERSQDFDSFSQIGKLNASGQSFERLQYELIDETPQTGINYYRLKMVDEDGKYAYSNIQDVLFGAGQLVVVVAPNPASPSQIRVLGERINPEGLALYDVYGRRVMVYSEATDGYYLDIFPKQTLSSGLYVLSLNSNEIWKRLKVLIH